MRLEITRRSDLAIRALTALGAHGATLAWSHARTALLDTLADTTVGDRPQED